MSDTADTKCFIIATSWHQGAVSVFFRDIAQRLVERGYRVVMLVDQHKYEVESDGNPVVLCWPSMRPTRLRDLRFLLSVIDSYSPDCVIGQFSAVNVMTLGGWLRRVPARLIWYHTLTEQLDQDTSMANWLRNLLRWRKRIVFQMATTIVTNSHATARDVQASFGVAANRVRVVYNAIDDPQVTQGMSPLTHDPSRLFCPGRFMQSKGQDVFIRALAKLKHAGMSFTAVFAGDGPEREANEVLAAQLGIQDDCQFLGVIPHREIYIEAAKSAMTVVPSRAEAFGLVAVESIAVGTPVIATSVGGLAEIIEDGVNGLLVPPDDVEALTVALTRLLRDGDLQATMRTEARRRFTTTFTNEVVKGDAIQWLEQIVATH